MDSEVVAGAPKELTPEEEAAMKLLADAEGEKLATKIKYLGYQIDTMDPNEKLKYTGQFDKLAKSMSKLRRMLRKRMPDNSWQWTVWICIALLVLIYG